MIIKKCPHCGKVISEEAKFCGYCGGKFTPQEPKKKLVASSRGKEKTKSRVRPLIYVVLFFMYLSISYFPRIGQVIGYFYERSLELKIYISGFQRHFIDVLIYIFDFICSIFFVGLFAYWFRGLRIWKYLLIGLLMKYWFALLMIAIAIFKGQSPAGIWPESFLFMLAFQITAVLTGAFIGTKIVSRFGYSDERDKTDFFFYGLSKRFWFIITIVYNPILQFLNKLSVFAFFTASKSINDNWSVFFSKGYLFGVLIAVLIPFVLLAVSLKLFVIGIEAVKNKSAKFRKLKIAVFLIGLPLLTILIPIIRNRTWFF